MKNRFVGVVTVAVMCMVIAGCGSTVESDARKLADLECKARQLSAKAAAGDLSVATEMSKIGMEAAQLGAELKGKYTTTADKEAFAKAYLEAYNGCTK